jgi:hypothetical protein
MAGALGGLREGLINGQRTGRVRRPSAWRDECRTAALLTICGFKRLRQQLMLYNLKILKSSAGSSTARKPFQKASETRTARVSVSMLQRAACRRRTSGPAHMHGVVCTGRACPVSCVHAIPVSMPSLCPCHPCVHAIPMSMPSRGLRHERGQRGRRERERSAQRRGRGSGGQRERGRRSRRRHQEEEATKEEVEGRTVSSTTPRYRRTGLGTRGMRIRYCSHGSVSLGPIVTRCF